VGGACSISITWNTAISAWVRQSLFSRPATHILAGRQSLGSLILCFPALVGIIHGMLLYECHLRGLLRLLVRATLRWVVSSLTLAFFRPVASASDHNHWLIVPNHTVKDDSEQQDFKFAILVGTQHLPTKPSLWPCLISPLQNDSQCSICQCHRARPRENASLALHYRVCETQLERFKLCWSYHTVQLVSLSSNSGEWSPRDGLDSSKHDQLKFCSYDLAYQRKQPEPMRESRRGSQGWQWCHPTFMLAAFQWQAKRQAG
jgi:hypothetical protein